MNALGCADESFRSTRWVALAHERVGLDRETNGTGAGVEGSDVWVERGGARDEFNGHTSRTRWCTRRVQRAHESNALAHETSSMGTQVERAGTRDEFNERTPRNVRATYSNGCRTRWLQPVHEWTAHAPEMRSKESLHPRSWGMRTPYDLRIGGRPDPRSHSKMPREVVRGGAASHPKRRRKPSAEATLTVRGRSGRG
jgi:hypothetical protein